MNIADVTIYKNYLFKLPIKLHREIKTLAAKRGVPMHKLIIEALQEFLIMKGD